MAETWILDPSEIATGRTPLDITPWVSEDGLDFGDATIDATKAEMSRGEIPVDYRVPNRTVAGGLVFAETKGGTTTTQARTAISAKLALIQRQGGWLKRITNNSGTIFADAVDATFSATSTSGWESRANADIDASFSVECTPDWYEAETTDSDNVNTTGRELIFTTAMSSGQGDVPNRVRLVVDNDGTTDWRGLIWAFRCKNYPGATAATPNTGTAAMAYEAEVLQPLDTAAKAALTGASGGTVVTHGTLSTNWTPVLGSNIGGTTFLTHTGTYQLWAEVYSTSGTTVQSRAVYDVGDLVNPAENDSFRMPGASNKYIKNYGEVRLDPTGQGTHRWQFQIQARGDVGGENFSVDKVWLVNTDDGYGVLTAAVPTTLGLSTYSARSEFNTESGAITGDSMAVGGTWIGAGDATDISVSGGIATRSEVSDTGPIAAVHTGRVVTASAPTFTTSVVQMDFKFATVNVLASPWLVARYSDINNLFAIGVVPTAGAGLVSAVKRISSSSTTILTTTSLPTITAGQFYTMQMAVDAVGGFSLFFGTTGSTLTLIARGQDSSLATGGSLASGKVGFADLNTTASVFVRSYDNFAAWAPSGDAVSFASRSAQLTTDAHIRQDASGSAYGPISNPIGDLPRFPLPPSGGGTVETILIPTEGDFDQTPDGTASARSISARTTRRPSWLFVDDT